jgi:hypothetical protein
MLIKNILYIDYPFRLQNTPSTIFAHASKKPFIALIIHIVFDTYTDSIRLNKINYYFNTKKQIRSM